MNSKCSFFRAVAMLYGAFGLVPNAAAYLVPTHQELTEHAAKRSVLGQSALRNLGISSLDSRVDGRSVLDWMRRGADFEDETWGFDGGEPTRYRHHFYNPLNGQGFTHSIAPNGYPSPTWGLEDKGDIPSQNYSLKDAHNFLLAGLTLANRGDREKLLAKAFESLGHAVHLVQDAGQPQHTRNDSHATSSFYEVLTNDNVKSLPIGDYPVVQLPNARDYFHSMEPGINNVLQGKGLAEYSNRGFITEGTNFSGSLFDVQIDPDFPYPNMNGATILSTDARHASLLGPASPVGGEMKFVGTDVVDTNLNVVQFNPRTTVFSILNFPGGSTAKFSYNRFVAEEAQKFLIPRAVSYSAGLINWFFRGKIDMVKDPNNANQYLIKNLGTDALRGTFTLYYDDVNDVRKPVDGAHWTTANLTPGNQLDPAATIIAPAFTPPTDAKTANTYTLVFVGKIGADIANASGADSIAAKVFGELRPSVVSVNWISETVNANDTGAWSTTSRIYVYANHAVFVFEGIEEGAWTGSDSGYVSAHGYPSLSHLAGNSELQSYGESYYLINEVTYSQSWPGLDSAYAHPRTAESTPIGVRTVETSMAVADPNSLDPSDYLSYPGIVKWSHLITGNETDDVSVGISYAPSSNVVQRGVQYNTFRNGVTIKLAEECFVDFGVTYPSETSAQNLFEAAGYLDAVNDCISNWLANTYSVPMSEWVFVGKNGAP